MESVDLKIGGMHCEGCVKRVQETLIALPGVQVQEVKVGSARVTLDPRRTSPQALRAAVEELGFTAKQSGSWLKRMMGK